MARPRVIDNETRAEIIADYLKGHSFSQITAKYRCSKGWLSGMLKSQGVLVKHVGQPKSDNPYESLETFVTKLKDKFNRGDIDEEQMGKEYNRFIEEYEKRQDLAFYKNEIPAGLMKTDEEIERGLKYTKSIEDYSNDDKVPQSSSTNGEIFDDMCKQILEDLQSNVISKQEAQLKWMFLKDEFEELGQMDFDTKYEGKLN